MTAPKGKKKLVLLIFVNLIILLIFLSILEIFLRSHMPIIAYQMDVSGTIAKQVGWGPEKIQNNRFLCDFNHSNKDSNQFHILTVGDSMLACNPKSGIPFKETIPGVLGGILGDKYELYNLAAGGWGTDQELIAYQNYNPEKFDLVLLFFTPANDLYNNSTNKAIGQNLNKPYFSVKDDVLVLNSLVSNELNMFQKLFTSTEIGKRYLLMIGKGVEDVFNFPAFDNKSSTKYEHERFSHIAANFKPMLPRYKDSWEITKKIILKFKNEVETNQSKFAIIYLPTGVRNLLNPIDNFPTGCIGYAEERTDIKVSHHNYDLVLNPYLQYNLMKNFTLQNNINFIDSFLPEFQRYAYKHSELASDCIHFTSPKAIKPIVNSLKEYIFDMSNR
mgnify:CR=1 FL=1|tara:strand:- start:332 stop:1495 length:1164 start_codon:yes stop_codon:yes gene_type:complete